jgi:single-stranded-DNA-specific exonuclease
MKQGMADKIWIMARKISKKILEKFPKINPIILQLLINRGIKEIDQFLEPNFEKGRYNPFLLSDVKKAQKRIKKAISAKEKIAIFGHYDCDGICAAVLMAEALEFLGVQPKVYIPERRDGYQIRKERFEEFKKNKVTLLITVDFGITDILAAEMAKESGIDLIICDHHQPPKKLPKCFAIINPLCSSKYLFKELSGTGVVYKLVETLISEERFLKWALELVVLATVADVVPLISENRTLTKFGLIALRKTKRLGLIKLFEKAGIDKDKINTYTIGFQIAPRLNASGRMDQAVSSYYLLRTKDERQAEKLATDLNNFNQKRQSILDKSLNSAMEKIKKDGLNKDKIIIVSSKDWAEGILGLIAGKVTEFFCKPSIVLREEEEFFKGSARSIDGFHITNALREYEDILEKVGGHKKAAGMTVKKDLMKDLYDKLTGLANQKITDDDILPKVMIDVELSLKNINESFWENILKFEPYGYGNPKPLFATKNLKIVNISRMGKEGKHLSLILKDEENFISVAENPASGGEDVIRAVGFEMGKLFDKFSAGDKIDVAYNLDLNQWSGNQNLELKLIDIKESN